MSDADRAKWDERYRTKGPESPAAHEFLIGLDLPPPGRALDVAGGAGRNAVWLARRGWRVTLVDISAEGLALAKAAAGTLPLEVVCADLEREPLPAGPFDLIVSTYYLRRELFADFADRLSPGGLLVYVQPTRSNLQRHPHPSAAFLLEDGELPALAQGLTVVRCDEGWFRDGESERHEARLVARKR
jgi:SAM-dependent methyltransferase